MQIKVQLNIYKQILWKWGIVWVDNMFKLNTVLKIVSLLYKTVFKRPLIKYVLALAYIQM